MNLCLLVQKGMQNKRKRSMVWFCEAESGEQVIEQHEVLAPLFGDFYASFYQQVHISPGVLELCRLRIAQAC